MFIFTIKRKLYYEVIQYVHTFVGLISPIVSALECEANLLSSIHSSGELKLCIAWIDKMKGRHYGLGRCLIHGSRDLASVGLLHHALLKALFHRTNEHI